MLKSITYLVLFTILSGWFSTLCAQTDLKGYVKDQATGLPIAYCSIAIKNNHTGTISNEEGEFILSMNNTDTLLFSCIGYKKQKTSAASFIKNSVIKLIPNVNTISEVTVTADNSFLYDIMENCRKRLLLSKDKTSKVYFVLESEIEKQPVELLESYYNGTVNNSSIKDLRFKNGRVGVAPRDSGFFLNLNTSKAIAYISLLNNNGFFPVIPFQLSKAKLKKEYNLTLKSLYTTNSTIYHITYSAVQKNGSHFDGEVWVDKNNYELVKIILTVSDAQTHPFTPIFPKSKIEKVDLEISKSYKTEQASNTLEHINFSYTLKYSTSKSVRMIDPETPKEVTTKCLMYFYDYDHLFFIPHFEYNNLIDDYRKISLLSYNDDFWKDNKGLIYSEKMRNGIRYFKTNGFLINYKGKINSGTKIFETNNIIWNKDLRISVKKNIIKDDTLKKYEFNNQPFLSSLYNLKSQIFFDVNTINDTIRHYSVSVFDVYETFYHLPEESYTNCFINIYFDLCEIERRKMEEKLSNTKLTIPQIDLIYTEASNNLHESEKKYLKEVQMGKNTLKLKAWNQYVYEQLNIDNFKIFNITN
ncbi:MAG: carboxypeptidase-like regulatory domain-containing protein [Bacteroidota bacterium]